MDDAVRVRRSERRKKTGDVRWHAGAGRDIDSHRCAARCERDIAVDARVAADIADRANERRALRGHVRSDRSEVERRSRGGDACTFPTHIERTFHFSNFRAALNFVRDVGELAETEGHHPDVSFGWGYATISLRTKKIKGLHENDFIMASKIDRMFDGLERPPDRQ